MSTETPEHTKQLYAAAYVAGQRLIEATATWERLDAIEDDDAWDQAAYTAAERCMHEAMDVLASVLRAAGLPQGAYRLVWGADGLMHLRMDGAVPMAAWVEEPVDVRPVQRERPLWRSTAVAGGTV
jgi:hypothetical protein